MDIDEDGADNPFRRPDFYRASAFDTFLSSTEGNLFPDIDFEAPLKPLNTLPTLQLDAFSFENPFSLSISSPPESHASSDDVREPLVDESIVHVEDEDIWLDSALEVAQSARFLDWDAFLNNRTSGIVNCYVTEAGSAVFNAAISLTIGSVPIADEGLLSRSLLALGLGRNSILFRFDDVKATFRGVKSEFRLTGCTDVATESLVERFRRCGDTFRKLGSSVDQMSGKKISGLFALREVLASALDILQEQIYTRSTEARSILQLDEVFEAPVKVLRCLEQAASLTEAGSDVELLNAVFSLAEKTEQGDSLEYGIFLHILQAVSSHWLQSVEAWIGTSRDRFKLLSQTPLFARKTDESDSEYEIVPDQIPTFLLDQDKQLLFYAGQTLRLLEKHDSEHPLVRNRAFSSAPRLEWNFEWQDAKALSSQAEEYEVFMQAQVQAYYDAKLPSAQPASNVSFEFFPAIYGSSSEEIQTTFALEYLAMDQPPPLSIKTPLRPLILSSDTLEAAPRFSPPLILSSSLSFSPVIAAQSKLINTAALRLVFQKHHLLEHVSIIRRFYLFADSAFVSRLSDALFTSSGLALSSRDSWPPASSELRLALADVLTASLRGEPPGGLSFSIREMEDADLEKCLDAGSIAALDFLKLSYTAPDTLGRVISQKCLERYDILFQFLLRVLRVDATAHSIWMDRRRNFTLPVATRRAMHDLMHFLTALKTYILTVAIERPWAEWSTYLSNLQSELSAGGSFTPTTTLDDIKQQHETVLDTMMTACLLRKRQGQVQAKIESILAQILQLCSDDPATVAEDQASMARADALRKDIRVLVTACAELSGEQDRDGANLLKEFVLLLNYSGAYSITKL